MRQKSVPRYRPHLLADTLGRNAVIVGQRHTQSQRAMVSTIVILRVDEAGDIPNQRSRVEAACKTSQIYERGLKRSRIMGGHKRRLGPFKSLPGHGQDLAGGRIQNQRTCGAILNQAAGRQRGEETGSAAFAFRIRRTCQPGGKGSGHTGGLFLEVIIQGGDNGKATAFNAGTAKTRFQLRQHQVYEGLARLGNNGSSGLNPKRGCERSGGLLLCVPPGALDALLSRAAQVGQVLWVIGEVVEGSGIEVVA